MNNNKELIIFLDIDGVLNSFNWSKNHPSGLLFRTSNDIDPKNINALNSLLNENENKNIKIVISSDWRKLLSIDELKKIFSFFNFPTDRIIGYTPIHQNSQKREIEIISFLEKHNNIKNFVILDNDDLFSDLKLKLVKTNPKIGLTKNDLFQIKKILEIL